jgi:tetratricopeptide (TPR) repeat protein
LGVTDPEEVVRKLQEYSLQLGHSNLLESQLRVETELLAFCKASNMNRETTMDSMLYLSITLSSMSRYSEAEIFARELVEESEKETLISEVYVYVAENLSNVLHHQDKFEEALAVAHDAVERFRPVLEEGDAMVRLMEAESDALRGIGRHQEALDLARHCIKTRTDHPYRFKTGEEVPFGSYYSMAQSLICVGGLDEAEVMLKKALAVLESNGIEIHPQMVQAMDCLGAVYRDQGRKKEAKSMFEAVKKLVPQVFPKDHPDYKLFMEE